MNNKITINLDDPSTWPERILRLASAELGRRGAASRSINTGGRPRKIKPCPHCGVDTYGRLGASHIKSCIAKSN